MSESKACPEVIYLQACDKCYTEAIEFEDDGVSWCVDEIGHSCEGGIEEEQDTKYIRKDRYDALQSDLSALKHAVKDARDEMENYASEEQYDDEYLGLEHAVRIMNSHGLIGKE